MDTANRLLTGVMLSTFALWAPANADPHSHGGHGYHDAGPYVGGAIGRGFVETGIDGALEDFDGDDTAYKVFLGFGFSEYIRLEAGYVDLGELEDELNLIGIGNQRFGMSADGPTLGLELGLPLGENFSITARGGVVFWEAEARISGFGLRDDGEDPFYGIGLRYRLGPHASLLGSAERFELEDVDVDLFSLGVSFHF